MITASFQGYGVGDFSSMNSNASSPSPKKSSFSISASLGCAPKTLHIKSLKMDFSARFHAILVIIIGNVSMAVICQQGFGFGPVNLNGDGPMVTTFPEGTSLVVWTSTHSYNAEFVRSIAAAQLDKDGYITPQPDINLEYRYVRWNGTIQWEEIPEHITYINITCLRGRSWAQSVPTQFRFRWYPNLVFLSLFCKVQTITYDLFAGLSELSALYFGIVRMEHIDQEAFKDLKNLIIFTFGFDNEPKSFELAPKMFCGMHKLYLFRLGWFRNGIAINTFSGSWETPDTNLSDVCVLPSLAFLEITFSNLTSLPNYSFTYLTDILEIHITDSNLTHISRNAFDNLPTLQHLTIHDTHHLIRKIPESALRQPVLGALDFAFCCRLGRVELKKLRTTNQLWLITLKNNFVTTIEGSFSRDVSSNILTVMLHQNQITRINSILFKNMIFLKYLFLQNNHISYIHPDAFEHTTSLEKLRLDYNRIKFLPKGIFRNMKKLLELNLAFNELTKIHKDAGWIGCESLTHISFSNNLIEHIEDSSFMGMKSLQVMFLDFNQLNQASIPLDILVTIPPASQHLVLEGHVCANRLQMLSMNDNKMEILNSDILNGSCMMQYLSMAHNNISRIEGSELIGTPEMKFIDLSNNKLTKIRQKYFTSLTKLKQIRLYNNDIEDIDSSLFEGSQQLNYVALKNNKLASLDATYLWEEYFLKNMTLSSNLWDCSCDNEEFVQWFQTHTHLINDEGVTYCSTPPELKGLLVTHVNISALCDKSPETLIRYDEAAIIVVSVVFALLVIISSVVYKFRREIQILLYVKYGWRLQKNDPQDDCKKPYDAFVSFNNNENDEQFVLQQLLPKLEREFGFRLCVHFRDFVPGVAIAENIVEAIQNSRRTIMLLSTNFLESDWCRYEFQQAHFQALDDRTKRLIVILMEPLDNKTIDNPELKAYMRVYTYLSVDDRLFWKKLLFAMPEKRDINRDDERAPLLAFD